ncbi:MAG: hypothetical protein R3E95_13960 [Thiolinea sp.]
MDTCRLGGPLLPEDLASPEWRLTYYANEFRQICYRQHMACWPDAGVLAQWQTDRTMLFSCS